jgi:hypothetical protein
LIKFRYEPTLEDYLFLNRHVLSFGLRVAFVVVIGIIALSAALPFLMPRPADGAEEMNWQAYWRSIIPLLVAPFVVAPLVVLFLRRAARKRWNAAEELRVPRDYEFSDDGVRMSGGSISGAMEWRHIVQAEMANGFVLLKTGQNQYYYFPTSVLPDFNAFLNLVSKHVKVTKNWKQTTQ